MTTDDPLPTRPSLLSRLRDLGDDASWSAFDRTYRGLIFGVARRAGLNDADAREVVQDTLLTAARKLPEFHYEPGKDSFKGWLLQVTRWRIADHLRRRARQDGASGSGALARPLDDRCRRAPALHPNGGPPVTDECTTSTVERLPDPHLPERVWDEEWERNLVQVALGRIKRQVRPEQYEIYHLRVILGRPVAEVTRMLGVNAGQVYLAKHRVGALLKREVLRIASDWR